MSGVQEELSQVSKSDPYNILHHHSLEQHHLLPMRQTAAHIHLISLGSISIHAILGYISSGNSNGFDIIVLPGS